MTYDPAFSATYDEALAKRRTAAVEALAAALVPYSRRALPVARAEIVAALRAFVAAL